MSLTDDSDFLSLLSTQREILKELNREKGYIAIECDATEPMGQTGESSTSTTTTFTSGSIKSGSFSGTSDPFDLMNEPIMERRFSREEQPHKAKSRRISECFDILSTCTTPLSANFQGYKKRNKSSKAVTEKCFQLNRSESGGSVRHNHLYGILANSLVFDVDSTTGRTQHGNNFQNTEQIKNGSFVDTPKERRKRVQRIHPKTDLASLRGEFENFLIAMEKSMKSQQDIHNWDRMMGLKRSHSKTMRLSMRSRNKLRKVINV